MQDVLPSGSSSEAAARAALRESLPGGLDRLGADESRGCGATRPAPCDWFGRLDPGRKFAVIRGLPRYVSSQRNGVRLPTADENKRAVELDQFRPP